MYSSISDQVSSKQWCNWMIGGNRIQTNPSNADRSVLNVYPYPDSLNQTDTILQSNSICSVVRISCFEECFRSRSWLFSSLITFVSARGGRGCGSCRWPGTVCWCRSRSTARGCLRSTGAGSPRDSERPEPETDCAHARTASRRVGGEARTATTATWRPPASSAQTLRALWGII